MNSGLVLVEPGDVFADTALIAHFGTALVFGLFLADYALIADADVETCVEEGLLLHTGEESVIIVNCIIEHFGVGLKTHDSTGYIGGADDGHVLSLVAAGKLHLIDAAVLVNFNLQPLGKSVNNRRTDTVQTAGDLVASAAELTACVQNGINNLKCGLAGLFLNINGNTAAVIAYADNIAFLDSYFNFGAVACQRLVDSVVNYFVYKVMQTGSGGGTDVHAGAFSNRLKSFKNLNLARIIIALDFFGNISHLYFLPYLSYSRLIFSLRLSRVEELRTQR